MPTTPTPITSTAGVVRVSHRTDEVLVTVGSSKRPLVLEPADAARLAEALTAEAQNAIHAERLTRRTT